MYTHSMNSGDEIKYKAYNIGFFICNINNNND
jgi:hypothetical protein